METTTTKTNQGAQAAFVPIPDLDKMAVGHAGLYETDNEDIANAAIDTDVVSADITLGIKGGKTLIDCEKGIKAFVKDVLAADKTNHLPNTETGVWVHYLTQGVMRDFNRTWEKTPVSLREKQSYAEKSKAQGKRVLSKKEKNELLAARNFPYYQNDLDSGAITMEQAVASMIEAAAKVKELEDAGYYLSPNKTQGVALFDWKAAVIEGHKGNTNATKIYTKNKVSVIIPNVVDNYFSNEQHPRKLAKELEKSPLALTEEVVSVLYKDDKDFIQMEVDTSIKTESDLYKFLKENSKFASIFNTLEKEYNITGYHLTKLVSSGMMKPRQVCIDCVSRKDGAQHLFLLDKDGGVLHFQ